MGKYDHLTREELIKRLEEAEYHETAKLQDRLDGEKRIAQALVLMLENYNENYEEDILRIVLERYQADRAFIFQFDWTTNTNSNIHEVNSEGIAPEIQNLQNLPNEALGEYLQLFCKGQPLVVNDINQMPEFTYQGPQGVKQIFQMLHLKSAILFPMQLFGTLWGFIGMETVRNYRFWTKDDIEWLKSFTNILSISVSQRHIRNQARLNERRFADLFENMPVGYIRHRIICDANGQAVDYEYLEANPAFEKLTGLNKESCIGKTARQIGGTLNKDLFHLFTEVAFHRKQTEIDYPTLFLGKWFYSVLYSPCYGEFISLFYDITDRVIVTEQIKQNERKLRTIFDNLPVGILSFDAKGHFLETNQEMLRIFGNFPDQNVNLNLQLSLNNQKKLTENGEISFDFCYDTQTLKILHSSNNIPASALYLNGKIVKYAHDDNCCFGHLLIITDNTKIQQTNLELVKAQKALTENVVRLSMILETGQIYPIYINAEAGLIDISEDFYKQFPQIKSNHPSHTIDHFIQKIHWDDQATFQEEYQKLQNGQIQRIKIELRLNISGNNYTWCELNITAKARGKNSVITQWLGFLTIIQGRKDNEKQLIEALKKAEESDKLKSAFLANVSHEIRTPLNAIVGFSELIAHSDNGEDKKYYLDIVKTNNNLLLSLINDILDLSKIESGRIDLKESPVNIKDLCQEVCHVHQLRAKPGVKVIFATPTPLIVQTDPNRLTQIYSNLINNAIKNTESGSITVGYQKLEKAVEFFVRDTGKGIPQDKQSIIFNRFEKLNSNVQGFGLGLSICKSILEKMQGSISLTSEEGKGSEFTFTIPCSESSATKVIKQSPLTPSGNNSTKPLILIAEDEDCNYKLLKNILEEKYRFIYAASGIEAVNLFSSESPDLILIDMKMTEFDGIEPAQIIREVSPKTPIIALTAFACDSEPNSVLQRGCNDFLNTPLEAKPVIEIIEKYLN